MDHPAFKFSTPEAEAEFDKLVQVEYDRHAEALYAYLERNQEGDMLGAVLALRGVEIAGLLQIAATIMGVWAGVLHHDHGGADDEPVAIAAMARTTLEAIAEADNESTEASDA